ncbi:proximal tail fiber subunit [Klebsiella phage CPRSA]|nr:proximal tail fiber subunit [Klebsiella phage CPRSA]
MAGSTLPDDGYAAVGVAVSPYELNLTLKHYLPIGAKAVDADKLDNLDSSSSFVVMLIRRSTGR